MPCPAAVFVSSHHLMLSGGRSQDTPLDLVNPYASYSLSGGTPPDILYINVAHGWCYSYITRIEIKLS